MALVVLSKVEQRLDAVRAVLAGASVVEVAAAFGVSRISVHAWLRRYLAEGLAGLVDRSHRPRSCPHQVSDSVAVLGRGGAPAASTVGGETDPDGVAAQAARRGRDRRRRPR